MLDALGRGRHAGQDSARRSPLAAVDQRRELGRKRAVNQDEEHPRAELERLSQA